MLDELLLSLPPDYALVAFEMAAKQGVSCGGEGNRPKMQWAFCVVR